MVHKASALLFVLSLIMVTLCSATLSSNVLMANNVDLGQAASIATQSDLVEAKVQLKVPTRDDRFLAATIHKPKKKGRYPTIVLFTPYNRLILDQIISKTDLKSTLIDRQNYVFVTADWRGFHASRRSRKWFWQRQSSSKQLGQDGYDLVEWVARQSWSNGKVGMWGASALGQAQYRTAAQRPPHLTCICPIAIRYWESYEQHYYDGCPKYGRTLARDQAGFRGTARKVTKHPIRDSFWDEMERNTRLGLEKIDVPVLVIGGWYDLETSCLIDTFKELKLRSGKRTRKHSKLLIGPWDHVNVAAGRLKVGEEEYKKAHRESEMEAHRFFAYWLRGEKNAWPKRSDIRYFQLGTRQWLEAKQWPPQRTKERRFYLGSNDSLTERIPQKKASASWTADPNEPTPTLGGNNISVFWRRDRLKVEAGPKDQSALLSRDDVLSFTSHELSSSLVLTGRAKVRVHMMTDCRDTDLMVRLCDLHPNGKCMLVTDGARRARFRHTTRREDFVEAEKRFALDVTLPVIAHTFKKGHSIKLIFSSSNYPRFAINPQNGRHFTSRWRKNEVAVNSLFFGGKSSSVTFPCRGSNELLDENNLARPKKEARYYERKGPYSVYMREFPSLQDKSRGNRSVPIKVFYPDRAGPFPLVVVTHGGGGNWNASTFQVKHLVSHGYVVFAIEHVFSNTKRCKFYLSRQGGRKGIKGTLDFITRDQRAVLERPKDVSFAIDKAIEWNEKSSFLKGRVKLAQIAVMGHSFGAYTTLVACGAKPCGKSLLPPLPSSSTKLQNLADERVDVGIAMSPQGPNSTFFNENSYQSINRPLLCFSGTRDKQKARDNSTVPARERLRGFELFPPGDKYMLWLNNADHMGFSHNASRPWPIPNKARDGMQRISKTMILLFLQSWLKEDQEANALFTEAYANTLTDAVVDKVWWYEK